MFHFQSQKDIRVKNILDRVNVQYKNSKTRAFLECLRISVSGSKSVRRTVLVEIGEVTRNRLKGPFRES